MTALTVHHPLRNRQILLTSKCIQAHCTKNMRFSFMHTNCLIFIEKYWFWDLMRIIIGVFLYAFIFTLGPSLAAISSLVYCLETGQQHATEVLFTKGIYKDCSTYSQCMMFGSRMLHRQHQISGHFS